MLTWIRQSAAGRAVQIVAATTLTHTVTFVQEVLIARHFGVSAEMDAYIFGLGVFTFLSSLLAAGVAPALVPLVSMIRRKTGVVEASAALDRATGLFLVYLVTLTVVAAALSPLVPLLANRFAPAEAAISRETFLALTPALVISALSLTWELVLTTDGAPVRASLTPAVRPAVLVVGLAALPGVRVTILPWLLLGGHLVECVLAGVLLRAHGWRLWPRWRGAWEALRPAIRQYFALVAATILTSASALTDQLVAARLAPGSIASLTYAQRLTAPLVILSVALVNGMFLPRALDHVASGDDAALRSVVHRSMAIAAVLATLPTLVLFAFADPIVALVYRRGSFTDADVASVSYVVRFAVLHAPFAVVANVVNRAMLARNATHRLVRISITFPVLNLLLDVAFAPYFGAGGIALSTTLVNVYALAVFYVIFRKEVAAS